MERARRAPRRARAAAARARSRDPIRNTIPQIRKSANDLLKSHLPWIIFISFIDFDHTLPNRNLIPRGLDPTNSISRRDPHAKSTAGDPPVNSQVDETDGGPRGADNRRPRPARHSALPPRTRTRTDLDGIVGPLCSTNLRRRNGATHLFPDPRPLGGGGRSWSVCIFRF